MVAPVVLHSASTRSAVRRSASSRSAIRLPLRKKLLDRARGLLGDVDLALAQPPQQVVGRQVDELDLVGLVEQVGRARSRAPTTPVICATTSLRLSRCWTLSVV